jgi:hypothetical protein
LYFLFIFSKKPGSGSTCPYATILTVQEIIENKGNIYLCAKAFRHDATTLMLELAQKFNFGINDCGAWPEPVYKTNYYNKGTLDAEWTFYIHGSHCRFDNLQTGQTVEVLYTEKPEFGFLDGFFFYNYMQTTDRFKDLADWFISHTNVYAAIDILSEEGTLTKKPRNGSGCNALAL